VGSVFDIARAMAAHALAVPPTFEKIIITLVLCRPDCLGHFVFNRVDILMGESGMRHYSLAKLCFAFLCLPIVVGCARIETGEVGLRIGLDKQISGTELLPGSFNQTLIGSVLTFPVREIAVKLDNKTPLTLDNSTLADFDLTLVYSINPSSVSDLWATKSRSFHAFDDRSQDWYLMYNYIETIANNASYKAVREYRALEVADNRAKLGNL
jgi:hypothetical protein